MRSLFAALIVLALLFALPASNGQTAPIDIAVITSMTPLSGNIGDKVTITGDHIRTSIRIKFGDIPSIATVTTKDAGQQITTEVPVGAKTGPVYVVDDEIQIIAGIFIILSRPPAALDDPNVTGGSSGAGAQPVRGRTLWGSPSSIPATVIDPDLDLPIDRPTKAQPPAAHPSPSPSPPPPNDIERPTFYGHDLISPSNTVIYVLDISGSMGWDPGQYTTPDGKTKTGVRLDRAKAELVKSIISLPADWKFNIFFYDCSVFQWQQSLVKADPPHKEASIAYVMSQQPEDGTGTGPAVAAALHDHGNMLVVLLTDGAPNCGAGDESGDWSCLEAHRRMISQNNTQHAEIDVFGIAAFNDMQKFCQQVASDSGGTYTDVH